MRDRGRKNLGWSWSGKKSGKDERKAVNDIGRILVSWNVAERILDLDWN